MTPLEGHDLRLVTERLDALADPIAIVSEDGAVLARNAAFAAAAGTMIQHHLSPTMKAMVLSLILRGGGSQRLVLESPDGERVYDVTLLPAALTGTVGLIGGGREFGGMILLRDQTLDAGLRNALTISRARYKEMVEISSDFAWEVDRNGCFAFVAPQGLIGYKPRDLIGRSAGELMDPDHQVGPIIPFLSPTPLHRVEAWLIDANGSPACLEFSQVPLMDREGEFVGARGVCRDITNLRFHEAEASESRARERTLSRIVRLFRREAAPEAMIQAAASAVTHGLSGTGCQIFSSTTPQLRGVSRPNFVQEAVFGRAGTDQEIARVTLLLQEAEDDDGVVCDEINGRRFMAAFAEYGDRLNGVILVWRDYGRPDFTLAEQRLLVSIGGQIGVALEQLHNHRILVAVSRTDSLSGLLNRRAFYEDMQRRIRRLARSRETGALMYVDLDNFKMVNDTRGHEVGDEVLRRVAEILKGNTRGTDIVARLGGDEFAVWLDAADDTVAIKRADVFLAASVVLRKYSGSPQAPLMFSIGIAVYDPVYGEDMNQFISRADAAMYSVKQRGKGSYSVAPAPQGGRSS